MHVGNLEQPVHLFVHKLFVTAKNIRNHFKNNFVNYVSQKNEGGLEKEIKWHIIAGLKGEKGTARIPTI